MICAIFAAKLFDLMGWNKSYRYKILGKPAVCDNEVLYLFKLTDFEMFVNTGTRKTRSYLPEVPTLPFPNIPTVSISMSLKHPGAE